MVVVVPLCVGSSMCRRVAGPFVWLASILYGGSCNMFAVRKVWLLLPLSHFTVMLVLKWEGDVQQDTYDDG